MFSLKNFFFGDIDVSCLMHIVVVFDNVQVIDIFLFIVSMFLLFVILYISRYEDFLLLHLLFN